MIPIGLMVIVMIVLSVMYIGDAGWQWIAGAWATFILGTAIMTGIGISFAFVWVFQAIVVASIYAKSQMQ
jgi:hypothetical protein